MNTYFKLLSVTLLIGLTCGSAMADEVTPAPAQADVKPVRCTYASGLAVPGEVIQNLPKMPRGMAMVCASVKGKGVFLVVAKSSIKDL
jgi:hypothetical protein